MFIYYFNNGGSYNSINPLTSQKWASIESEYNARILRWEERPNPFNNDYTWSVDYQQPSVTVNHEASEGSRTSWFDRLNEQMTYEQYRSRYFTEVVYGSFPMKMEWFDEESKKKKKKSPLPDWF